MAVAPTGTSAWRRLFAGMRRPRAANRSRMRSAASSSVTSWTPITSAMASRVMSSWVGPRPPHTITASARASASSSAATMRSRLSPTTCPWVRSMPASASCSPSQAELVSTIWPSSSSVPTATTSQRTRPSSARRARADLQARTPPEAVARLPSIRYCAPRAERQRHGQPQHGRRQPRLVLGHGGQQRQADGHRLDDGLDLGPVRGRHREAAPSPVRAEHRDAELADGDERDRQPPEAVGGDQRPHRPEHQRLVGQRVEEGARAGGAVAAGQVAVDAVGGGQHDPDRERPRTTGPRPGSGATAPARTAAGRR